MLNWKPHPAASGTSSGPRRRAWHRPAAAATAVAGLAVGTAAAAADKSGYTLFHPVPAESMRELSTDRPDQMESAYTVDAGHIQLEMDFVNATLDRDRSGGRDVRTSVWGFGPFNLKVGLLNRVDLQFVLDAQVRSRIEDRLAGTVEQASGLGDLQTRLKINLWGDDGGRSALSMMPFVKWPLARSNLRNGQTEGGLIFPLAIELPHGWSLGLMTEFDFVVGDAGRHDTEFVNLINVGHDLVGKLAGYVEFVSVVSSAGDVAWLGQVDAGFTYAVNRNTQLDFGCNFGVTESAPDFAPFIGFSWRY